jgi:ABC-2 type transport system permease protein
MRQQLRRLKQPRYIIGVLAMVAYFVSLAYTYTASPPSLAATNPALLDIRQLLAMLGLCIALGAWWLAAPSDNALTFGPAEVYFLFPAPVKRRTLVQARLMSVQALLLAQVLVWTLLLRRSSGDLHGGLRAIGLWMLFTTISLHRLGATLARINAPDAPRRKPVAKSIAVVFLVLLGIAAARATPHALEMWRSYLDLSSYDNSHVVDRVLAGRVALQALLNDPVVHFLTWPIRASTSLAFARDGAAWLLSLPAALLVLAVHYLWILRDPQPFEELALGSSARFADRVARVRRGGSAFGIQRRSLQWTLGLHGHPAMALAWKNITAVTRTFRPRALIVTVLICLVIVVVSTRGESGFTLDRASLRTAFLSTLTGVFTAAVLTAPAWFRLDLRHDLTHLPFLKTAPLPAHTIVATEILTAATVTTTAMAVLFAPPAYYLLRSIGGPLSPTALALAVLGACIALAGVNVLHITLYNAVALWLPAWVPLNYGGASTGGASVVGQVYISLLGILLSLTLLLLLPVGAAWGVVALSRAVALPIPVAGAVALGIGMVVITLEWLALARLLGRSLDRLEPSDVPAATG